MQVIFGKAATIAFNSLSGRPLADVHRAVTRLAEMKVSDLAGSQNVRMARTRGGELVHIYRAGQLRFVMKIEGNECVVTDILDRGHYERLLKKESV